jgi:hypothetical protein
MAGKYPDKHSLAHGKRRRFQLCTEQIEKLYISARNASCIYVLSM